MSIFNHFVFLTEKKMRRLYFDKKGSNLLIFALLLIFGTSLHAQGNDIMKYIGARPYGGWPALKEFVRAELVYPRKQLKEDTEGEVILRFDIEEDGTTSNVRVVNSMGPDMDREALRVFRKVLWLPAISYEDPVLTNETMEVPFEVKKYRKWVRKRGYDTLPVPHQPIDTTYQLYDPAETDHPPRALFKEENQTVHGYINSKLKYPEEAYRRSLSGKVTLRFVIEQDGRVSNVLAVHPVGGGCTEEAERLLRSIRWYPAIHKGKAVRSIMDMDVIFQLPFDATH